jgi:adenosylmethionine-8-amino-7-oxononanoate aminotransferase
MRDLESLPIVGEARGRGLFMAVELSADASGTPLNQKDQTELVGRFIPDAIEEAGLLARVFSEPLPAVQLAPPLVTEPEDIRKMVDIVGEVLVVASQRMTS